MNGEYPRITPSEVGEHPELAVLEILDSALGMARFAIIAANPELTDSDPDTAPCDMEVLAATHILIAADTLHRVLASYRAILADKKNRTGVALRLEGDDPF